MNQTEQKRKEQRRDDVDKVLISPKRPFLSTRFSQLLGVIREREREREREMESERERKKERKKERKREREGERERERAPCGSALFGTCTPPCP